MGLFKELAITVFFMVSLNPICVSPTEQAGKRDDSKWENHNHYTKNADQPRVQIRNGNTVIGQRNKTEQNTVYQCFRGIRYAVPPVGPLRFKSPVALPKKISNQTVYAYNDGPVCTQSVIPSTIVGSEDCLYINVYVPQIFDKIVTHLPVMVWIYGGGFVLGDSTYGRYGPDYFLNEGVIFVSFNYRVGVFGYLSTEDNASPGNYAHKDQILALKWVNENIEFFGGNSSDITLFGESAGSVSVSILTQTHLTKGLFQKAIMESGTTLNLWALTRRPKEVALKIASNLGIETKNTTYLVNKLREINYKKLQAAVATTYLEQIVGGDILDGLPFGPTLEPPNPYAVYVNSSFERLSKGKFHHVPYLMGFNSLEAIPFIEGFNKIRPYLLKFDLQPYALLPASMNVIDDNVKYKVNSAIKSYYFGMVPVSLSEERLLQFVSDDEFSRPILEAVRFYSSGSPVYFYVFSYEGPLDTFYRKTTSQAKGAGHGDEMFFLFKSDNVKVKPSANDLLTRKRLIKLWTNFAKTSNPTPKSDSLFENVKWPIINWNNNGSLMYLDIGKNMTLRSNPDWKSFQFWLDLFKRYGNPPYFTF